ncbi:3-hydroxyacyl-CoA dehydrogenase [Variovorax defluvii]|uniref:3-hydroxyacyl-CoA dehydrogenase n=1 Tax=Variovorax defluvii TaxID=913761 RepID=A0ABP8IE33_9BURK
MSNQVHPSQAAIIGSGMIGRAWSIVFARAGWQVRLYSRSMAQAGVALQRVSTTLSDMAEAGLLDESPAAVASRILPTDSLERACTGSKLAVENIPETLELKRQVFTELDALCPPDAVLASSTSWLPASSFTESVPGRHRCLVAHPTNPPNLVPLVEVCPAPWTSPECVNQAMSIFTSVGQQPVLVRREIHGFLLNRIQGAVLNEVLNLFEQGFASTADLDKVMKYGLGLRWSFMGPLETIDLNAPKGVIDYAARYGETYSAVGKTQGANGWSPKVMAKIELERRQVLPEDQLAERGRWRDQRLMALRAHQRRQEEGAG